MEYLLAKKVWSKGTSNLSPHLGFVPPSSSTLVLYTWHFLSPLLLLLIVIMWWLYGLGGTVVKVMKGLMRLENSVDEQLVLSPSADSTVISRMNGC